MPRFATQRWYLGVYIDAFQWVELPNVIGMSQHADDDFLASKPYCCAASYVSKMSNYCGGCPYDPKDRTGPLACPLNALYWDFLARHSDGLRRNPRMALVMKQLEKIPADELVAIRATATAHQALAPMA